VVGGIYSPQPPNGRWGRLLSMGAPDSPVRHQTLSGAPPCHPTVRVLTQSTIGELVLLSHRTVRCATGQVLFTVRCASNSAALTLRALFICHPLLQSTVGASSRCSGGTPDSPMNYSGAQLNFPKSGWFVFVRTWCTGQSGAPVHNTLKFLLLLWI
jgi:hypothetical protein